MEFIKSIFKNLFEGTVIITNFLKSLICNTSCFVINTWFAISNNRELRNFMVRSAHSILKGMDDGSWKVVSGINQAWTNCVPDVDWMRPGTQNL